jgi:hypothetical protein
MAPIIKLSLIETEAFPVSTQELEFILSREQQRSASALLRYECEKRRLQRNNPGPISSWPVKQQALWLEMIAKIDAITAEVGNYIERLTSEVYQISH